MRSRVLESILLALVVACAGYTVYSTSFYRPLFQNGDNCGYLILGKALATGRGFANLSIPTHPQGLWWPPGFPVFVALFHVIAGGRWGMLKVLIFAMLYGSIFLFGHLVYRREESLTDSLVISTLLCLSSSIHLLSSYLYSETFFIVVSLTFFCVWERVRQRMSPTKLVGLSVWAVYVAAVRNVGMSLPLALVAYYGLVPPRRRAPGSRWYALIPLCLLGGYICIVTCLPAVRVGSILHFFGIHPYLDSGAASAGGAPGRVVASKLSGIIHTLRGYGLTLVPQSLFRSLYNSMTMNMAKAMMCAGVSLMVVWGWIVTVRTCLLANLYTLLFMAILFAYGPFYLRLVVPIVPFFILYFYFGTRSAVFSGLRNKAVASAAFGIVCMVLLADNARQTYTNPRRTMPPRFGDRHYQRCIEWVNENVPREDLVVSEISLYMYLHRGGYTIPYHYTDVPQVHLDFLDDWGAKYLMTSPFSMRSRLTYMNALRRAMEEYPHLFKIVFDGGDGRSQVVEYTPGSGVGEERPTRQEHL